MGLMGLQKAVAAPVVEWSNDGYKLQEPTSFDDYCVKANNLEPELAPEDQALPWEAWDEFIMELEAPTLGSAEAKGGTGGVNTAGKPKAEASASCASGGSSVAGGASAAGIDVAAVVAPGKMSPTMPTIPYKPEHRPKLRPRIPFNACVARPVSRKEQRANEDARKAMLKEWQRLRDMKTWDETEVLEWRDVAKKARRDGEEVHFGYLLGLCFEKGSELPKDHKDRKFKGRTVFQGDRVVNQNYEVAMFQDLGSSPATLEAARACDAFGCVPGHATQVADAPAAYVQADLKGTPCWVHLPVDAWPDDPVIRAKFAALDKPVVHLKKALYGHPDSGTFWEQHCDAHVRSVGFEPIGPEWPSCYFHAGMNLFLIIYVDDFKMSGPADKLDRGWELIEKGLNIDPPNDINGQTYLGCRQERMKVDLPGGGKATVDIKNMEEFMRSCVQLYLDLAPGATLRTVATPFLAEDQRDSPARGPAGTGPVAECPWCCHTFTPNPYSAVSALEKHRKAQRHAVSASADSKRGVPSGTGGASTAGTGGSGGGVSRWR